MLTHVRTHTFQTNFFETIFFYYTLVCFKISYMWAHRGGTDLLHLAQCFWNPSVLLSINGLIAGLSNKHHRHIPKHFQKKIDTANLPLVSDMRKQLLWTSVPKCGLWFFASREWTLRSRSLYSLSSWRRKYTTTITSHFIKTTTQLYKDDAESELTSRFTVWMMNCWETGSSFFFFWKVKPGIFLCYHHDPETHPHLTIICSVFT